MWCLFIPSPIQERKSALAFDAVVKKIGHSHPSELTDKTVIEHVDLLHELAPKWLEIVKIRSGTFVKLDRHAEMSSVLKLLQAPTQ